MAIPWFRILDAVIGFSDIARRVRPAPPPGGGDPGDQLATTARGGAIGHLETRLAGVVVAALKEAFDRDSRRLELERQQLDAERQRAERALRLEMMRQAADREIGKLRLIAGLAVVSWLGTLAFAGRLMAGGVGARVTLGVGWVCLLVALALSFVAQSRVGEKMSRADDYATPIAIDSGPAGAIAPWLIVAGLALAGFAVLLT